MASVTLCSLLSKSGRFNVVAATLRADDFLRACHAAPNTTNYRFNPLPKIEWRQCQINEYEIHELKQVLLRHFHARPQIHNNNCLEKSRHVIGYRRIFASGWDALSA